MNGPPNPPRRRARIVRRAAAATLLAIALLVGVIAGQSALDKLGDDETPTTEAVTNVSTVEVRDLTEPLTASGTLHYDPGIDVMTPVAGTVIDVVGTDTRLANGDVAAIVDDQVIVWLEGEIPAWRDLANGDEGIDVLQLETALTALGFNGDGDVTVDDEFTWTTATMVKDWQESLGVEQTGRVDLGTVVFGGDRTRVSAVAVAVGDTVTEDAALFTLGTDTRHAVLDAAPSDAVTLQVGDPATIELPDRSTIDGTVSAIDTGSENWQITVAFADDVEFPATDVTNVEMSWTNVIATDVLTVPSSALLRLDDGTYVVEVVGPDGTTVATVVTVGTAVGTRVEILDGVDAGTDVISL